MQSLVWPRRSAALRCLCRAPPGPTHRRGRPEQLGVAPSNRVAGATPCAPTRSDHRPPLRARGVPRARQPVAQLAPSTPLGCRWAGPRGPSARPHPPDAPDDVFSQPLHPNHLFARTTAADPPPTGWHARRCAGPSSLTGPRPKRQRHGRNTCRLPKGRLPVAGSTPGTNRGSRGYVNLVWPPDMRSPTRVGGNLARPTRPRCLHAQGAPAAARCGPLRGAAATLEAQAHALRTCTRSKPHRKFLHRRKLPDCWPRTPGRCSRKVARAASPYSPAPCSGFRRRATTGRQSTTFIRAVASQSRTILAGEQGRATG
jgi:hypothetical protein